MDFTLPAIFGAGALTFFTPCVLPMIPLYLSALLGGDILKAKGFARGTLVIRSLAFSVGFILVFSALGIGAGSIGAGLKNYSHHVQLIGGIIILIFGLKFLGWIEIPVLNKIIGGTSNQNQKKVTLMGSFLMGIVFAFGWSPCVGPVLGSVLTYTASAGVNIPTAILYLSIYGLGFAVPLILTASFAEVGVHLIRKTSRFLPIFERIMGIILLIAAGTLLGNIIQPSTSNSTSNQTNTADVTELNKLPGLPVMVEFYAENCQSCKKMAPLVNQLSQECHGNKVAIQQVNVSRTANQKYIKDFRLVGVPTFIFFDRDNHEIARLIGEQDERHLRQALSALRGEPCPGVNYISEDVFGLFNESCKSSHNCSFPSNTPVQTNQ